MVKCYFSAYAGPPGAWRHTSCLAEPVLLTSCQVVFTSASSCADRACLERAGCSQPANSRLRDAVGARQLCLRGALREALHGLAALMGCERRRPTEAHTLRLRAGAAGASSGEDQLALELGQSAEHGEHEPTLRRGRIGPGITCAWPQWH